MNHSRDRAEINQPVQQLPTLSTQPAYPAAGRSNHQRNQQYKSRQAHGNEAAFGDIGQHFVQVEELIQPNVSKKMEDAVKERKQPNHAPEANEPWLSRKPSQWRDGQRDKQESQRPVPGGMGDDFDRIGAKRPVVGLQSQQCERYKAREENNDFQPADRFQGHAQKFFLRSMPLYRLATCSPYPLNISVGRLKNSPSRRSFAWLQRG